MAGTVRVEGESFELTLSTNVGTFFGGATLDGRLPFDLPDGYTIRSCHGYAGAGALPGIGST